MEIQHQQFFLEKGNNFNNLGKKNFLCQTLFLHSSKNIFFFVKFLVSKVTLATFVFRHGDTRLKMVILLHLDCNPNSRKSQHFLKIKKQKKKNLDYYRLFFSNQKKTLNSSQCCFLSIKTVDAVFSSFCIFESIKN